MHADDEIAFVLEAAEATDNVFVMQALQYAGFLANFGVVPFAYTCQRQAFQDYNSTVAFIARFVDSSLRASAKDAFDGETAAFVRHGTSWAESKDASGGGRRKKGNIINFQSTHE